MFRWLRGPGALEELGERFDDLAVEQAAPITAQRAWLQAWIDTYRSFDPWIAVVEGDGSRLDAVAPLARRSRGGVLDVVGLGRGPSDYAFFPARTEAAGIELARGMADELARMKRPWRLRVEQLPAGDRLAASVAAALPVSAIEPGDPSPVVRLKPGAAAADHLARRLKQNVRTARNRLQREQVKVEVLHQTDPAAIGRFLPDIETVWRERDSAVGRVTDVDDPAGFGFFLSILRRLSARGEVDLTVLLLDGRVAAFAVCLVDGPLYRIWVPRISPRFAVYSPGHLVSVDVIERAIALGCTTVDWMRGVEPYKEQTANDSLQHEHLTAWSSPMLRAATDGLRLGRAALAERRERRQRGTTRLAT